MPIALGSPNGDSSKTGSTSTYKPPLFRYPQPYHRTSFELPESRHFNEVAEISNQQTSLSVHSPTPTEGKNGNTKPGFFDDVDHRKRRKISTSPSESGTEADDEGPGFLRGLPAPPARPRKGLKELQNTSSRGPLPSPLLTPSYLDDDRRRRSIERQTLLRAGTQTLSVRVDEAREIREKYTKRRRAELIRRLSETASLFAVACIVIYGPSRYRLSLQNRIALRAFIILTTIIYMCYVIIISQLGAATKGRLLANVRVPAAFDPAPLLYPLVLPVAIALALGASNSHLVLPNIILTICTIPERVMAFHGCGHNSLHWLLSLGPVLLLSSDRFAFGKAETSQLSNNTNLKNFDPETYSMLYPLHQALLPTLGFLTTTSLLPTELQLLTVALIDLLLYSTYPQALILKVLLWIGGMVLFILCRRVLAWEVTLARVPSWRFHRNLRGSRNGNTILRAIDDIFGGRRSQRHVSGGISSDSDKADILPLRSSNSKPKLSLRPPEAHSRFPSADTSVPMSARDQHDQAGISHLYGSSQISEFSRDRRRRHTLPTYIDRPTPNQSQRNKEELRSRLRHFIAPKSFLSLTSAQAKVLKWVFALYTFFVVGMLTLFVIRPYIGQECLNDSEPVGWALGYIFGNIPSFRYWTVLFNLEKWICLPSRETVSCTTLGRAERLRHCVLGVANTRLLISAYCVVVIAAGLIVVLRLSALVEVDTRRKVFHGMMVAMFLPVTFVDPAFAALALSLVLAIFLLLDLFRASQLPPVSRPLTYFLAPYVDGRDHRGPVIVSHIFLLIGCAIPLWLSLTATERSGEGPWKGWDVKTREVSMNSGVVCVGMGDAAASLIGRRYGRRRWIWSGGKSLEGSLAFAIAVVIGLSAARFWLLLGGWEGDTGDPWIVTLGKATVAATGASFTEAVLTGGNDNVVVPVILWLLVRGLKI